MMRTVAVGARKAGPLIGVLMVLAPLHVVSGSADQIFKQVPSPPISIVMKDDNVTYKCQLQHSTNGADIGWEVNMENLASKHLPGVLTYFNQDKSPNINFLNISTAATNTTIFTIQCITAVNNTPQSTEIVSLGVIKYHASAEKNTTSAKAFFSEKSSVVYNNIKIIVWLKFPRTSTGKFSLSLTPADGQPTNITKCSLVSPTLDEHEDGILMVLKANCSEMLPMYRVWDCLILEHNDTSNPIVTSNFTDTNFELSTHDIQNISISLINSTTGSTPNTISISADIINGSQSKGFLAIAQSAVDIHFVVALRQNGENTITTNITDIYGMEYSIAVYAITEDGLPFYRPASKPQKLNSSYEGDDNASLSPLPISKCVGNARKKFSESDSKKLVVVVANLSNSQNIYVYFSDNITDKDLHKQYAAIFHFVDGFISGNPITCTSSIDQGRSMITIIIVTVTALSLVAALVGFIIIIVRRRRRRVSIPIQNALPALDRVQGDGPSQPTTNERAQGDGPSLPTTDELVQGDGPSLPTTDERVQGDGPSQPTSDELVESDGPSQSPQGNNSIRFRGTGKDRHKS